MSRRFVFLAAAVMLVVPLVSGGKPEAAAGLLAGAGSGRRPEGLLG
jgi:hypothetical protein